MPEIDIERVAGPEPLFRLSSEEGSLARVLKIRVTEVGSEEPSWLVLHERARLDDLVQSGMITQAEADRAGFAELRFMDKSLLKQAAIVLSELKYGSVPVGMYAVVPAKALSAHRLYELKVSGMGEGERQFYA